MKIKTIWNHPVVFRPFLGWSSHHKDRGTAPPSSCVVDPSKAAWFSWRVPTESPQKNPKCQNFHTGHTVDGSEIRRLPVEVGSYLSHHLHGFIHPRPSKINDRLAILFGVFHKTFLLRGTDLTSSSRWWSSCRSPIPPLKRPNSSPQKRDNFSRKNTSWTNPLILRGRIRSFLGEVNPSNIFFVFCIFGREIFFGRNLPGVPRIGQAVSGRFCYVEKTLPTKKTFGLFPEPHLLAYPDVRRTNQVCTQSWSVNNNNMYLAGGSCSFFKRWLRYFHLFVNWQMDANGEYEACSIQPLMVNRLRPLCMDHLVHSFTSESTCQGSFTAPFILRLDYPK